LLSPLFLLDLVGSAIGMLHFEELDEMAVFLPNDHAQRDGDGQEKKWFVEREEIHWISDANKAGREHLPALKWALQGSNL
jgi:hypothetical protein